MRTIIPKGLKQPYSPKVIHLLPNDGIGGVEIAAQSMKDLSLSDLEFSLEYIHSQKKICHKYNLASFLTSMLKAIYRIIKKKPDLLIVSLWRACAVGFIIKLLQPKLKLVVFLHCPADVHLPDKILTRLLVRCSDQIWGDSKATIHERLPATTTKERRVISFVVQRLRALPANPVNPNFIYWGRIHDHKRLDRALLIFAEIITDYPKAHFAIIGPDGGALKQIREQVKELGLVDAVSFLGPMNMLGIKQQAKLSSFYLQTSELEGMAMSVVEAMQFGLVPIVTSVGEISNYCRDEENALLIDSNHAIVSRVKELISDNGKYQGLRSNSIKTWQEKPLYSDSIQEACRSLLLEDSK